MLKDIYAIPNVETRFKDTEVELTDELDVIIQQVDLLLFTNKGDVLLMPDFGCNLEQYLFETNVDESVIKNIIMDQINNYIYTKGTYNVDVEVSFVKWDFNVAMLVDLKINDRKIASYLI